MSDRRATAAFDVHQHLWPEPLVSALARRRTSPRPRGDVPSARWSTIADLDRPSADLTEESLN
jgi:hypothetical protein